MDIILKLILTLLFNTSNPTGILFKCLYIAGTWKVFEKSGLKSWWSLIPWARDYQLSRCANREPEGRVLCVTSFLSTILAIQLAIYYAGVANEIIKKLSPVFYTLYLTVSLIHLIYNIRIFNGLIEMYNVRKRWIWLCVFDATYYIPMLCWGFGKKYQPERKIEDMDEAMRRLTTEGNAVLMKDGLTVNITDRTVWEFFRKKMLLRDIHMSIPQGHLVLLLGGSGAGKTTYLNAITGYEQANAKVLLHGTDMYEEYKEMQYDIGFVPQAEMMRGKDTVVNTLMDAARLRLPIELRPRDLRNRVNEVMDIFGLQAVKHNKVEKLSGGQKKRLSISIEFLSNPSLFILDEPDSGLDGVMARSLFTRLRKIADSGRIVIVITHTPDRVADLFDDVIVLAKDSTRTGRLAYYGSIEDAREFFGCDSMEEIVKIINQKEEGGDGLADEYVMKYAEVAIG